jgi:uncharacterized cupin superfamily protein
MAANVFKPEWDAERDEDPYRWRRTLLGRQAGCERLGASVFELPTGAATFPLHVHHANEEMIVVLAGEPTLETLEGEKRLEAGEVFACPAGGQGAHRVRNDTGHAVRVLIISTMRAPEITEFPKTGELWVRSYPPGSDPPQGALDRRHSGKRAASERAQTPPLRNAGRSTQEKANIFSPRFDEGQSGKGGRARLGRQVGAKRLGFSLYELPPGFRRTAYHYHFANEELLIALCGRVSLRIPGGWRELQAGDLVAFPRGERGAHRCINADEEPARYLVASEMNAPDVVVYPDSEKVLAISRAPGSLGDEGELAHWFRIDDAVGYWEDEPGPVEDTV